MTVKVSVLMAVYNGERYLRQSVESILNQTYSDFEFIILDDGSNDSTLSILNEYAPRDRRMVLVRNETNIGLARSLNLGLELAQGEYIARMDADDISMPERLAVQVAYLETHSDIGVLGSKAYFVDDEMSTINYPENPDYLKWCLCFYNPIAHPSVMYRHSLIDSVGGYNEEYQFAQDYELWGRLSGITKLSNFQQVLVQMRKHEGNVTRIHADESIENSLKIGQKMMAEFINAPVPKNIVGCCHTSTRHWANWFDIIQCSLYLNWLYRANTKICGLTPEGKMMIANDRDNLFQEMLKNRTPKILGYIINRLFTRNR